MATLTCPLVTTCAMLLCLSWLHAPYWLAPCGCVHHVSLPLMAMHTMSPCPLWLCVSCHLAPHGCAYCVTVPTSPCFLHQLTLCLYVFFFLFLLTSSFAVQSLCSHHHPC